MFIFWFVFLKVRLQPLCSTGTKNKLGKCFDEKLLAMSLVSICSNTEHTVKDSLHENCI